MDASAAAQQSLASASSAGRKILKIGYYSLYIWSMGAMQLPPIPENISIVGLRLWSCVAQTAVKTGIIRRDWSQRLEEELLELGSSLQPLLTLLGSMDGETDDTHADHLLEVALRSADLYLPGAGWPRVGQLRAGTHAVSDDVIVMDRPAFLRLMTEVLRVARDTVSRAQPQGAGIYSLPLTPSVEDVQLALLTAPVDDGTNGSPVRLSLPEPPSSSSSPYATAAERSSMQGRSSVNVSTLKIPSFPQSPAEQWGSPGAMPKIRATRTVSPSPSSPATADAYQEADAPHLDLSPAGSEPEDSASLVSWMPSAPAKVSEHMSGDESAGHKVLEASRPGADEEAASPPRPRLGGRDEAWTTPRSTSSWHSSAIGNQQEYYSSSASKSAVTAYSSARSNTSDSEDEEGESEEHEQGENEDEGDAQGVQNSDAKTGAAPMPRARITMSPDLAPGGEHHDMGVGLVWTSSEE